VPWSTRTAEAAKIGPELTGPDLSGPDPSGPDLSGRDLSGTGSGIAEP